MTVPPYYALLYAGKIAVPLCGASRWRGTITVPPCSEAWYRGIVTVSAYGEPSGFFDFFLPRNGWMLKAASFSLS
jgi:hypothetical protein